MPDLPPEDVEDDDPGTGGEPEQRQTTAPVVAPLAESDCLEDLLNDDGSIR